MSALRTKWRWTPGFVSWLEQSVEGLSREFDVVFVDTGGRIDPALERVVRACGNVILLLPAGVSEEQRAGWMSLLERTGAALVGLLSSDLQAPETLVEIETDRVTGTVADLDRGRSGQVRGRSTRPVLEACLEVVGFGNG